MLQLESPLLLLIETGSQLCSVGLAEGGDLLALREVGGKGVHSRLITVLIEEVFEEAARELQATDAVALSSGPGSYTGLRVGASAAKGICYALGIPLLPVSTLRALALASREEEDEEHTLYISMLDAGRMEVYAAVYDQEGNEVESPCALVLEEGIFSSHAAQPLVFVGSGVNKAGNYLPKGKIFIRQRKLSAKNLLAPALKKFSGLSEQMTEENSLLEILASYQPLYLKAPHITSRKKKSC